MGSTQTGSDNGWQEQHVAFAEGVIGASMLRLTGASDAYQHTRRSHCANHERRFSAQSPQSEMFTIKEPFSVHWLCLFHHRHHRTDCTLRKINAGHRLIDLQGSGLAGLGINVAPVEKTKRHIAVFLHFKNHQIAQRMNGASWYENSVARLRSEGCEMIRHGPVRDRPSQIVCRGGRLEARVDAAFCPRLQHHPGFRFARSRLRVDILSADPMDAPGPRAFRAHRETSAARGTGGSARPVFPATAPTIAASILQSSALSAVH